MLSAYKCSSCQQELLRKYVKSCRFSKKTKPEGSKITELNDALDLYQLLKWGEGKSLGKVTRSP